MTQEEQKNIAEAYHRAVEAKPFKANGAWERFAQNPETGLCVKISAKDYELLEPFLHSTYDIVFTLPNGSKVSISGLVLRHGGILKGEDEVIMPDDPETLWNLHKLIQTVFMTCKRVKLSDIITKKEEA